MVGLKVIQDVFNNPADSNEGMRWLSREKAIDTIRCLPSVIRKERQRKEINCAQAAGLLGFIKKYKFVASLCMLSDVLHTLASLY